MALLVRLIENLAGLKLPRELKLVEDLCDFCEPVKIITNY